MAEKIRKNVENYNFKLINGLTISLGVSQYQKEEDIDTLLKRTDEALYIAKENGRNRVEVLLYD